MFDFDAPQQFGNRLSLDDQKYVLGAYVHRYTKDHKPAWASKPWKDGQPYPVQFASDADWLEHTLFNVSRSGRVIRRLGQECYSRPTWPDNPELRARDMDQGG